MTQKKNDQETKTDKFFCCKKKKKLHFKSLTNRDSRKTFLLLEIYIREYNYCMHRSYVHDIKGENCQFHKI